MNNSLAFKTIRELSTLIEKGEISPVDVTKDVIARTEAYDQKINSYISHSKEQALLAAKRAEEEIAAGGYKGELHGIPLALKDILNFKDEVVTMGSKIHKQYIPDFDAAVVKKLKEAGAVFTGKLNMHEYANGGTTNNEHYGACRNPWDLEHIPGGSSGGSGAAVAADLTIASLGTDTAGSIRIPASACGIVGLKPTHGLVSKHGCFPLSWSLDHIGPMTKTVEDAAIMLGYIAGFDSNDPTSYRAPEVSYTDSLSGDVKGKVIGIEEDFFFNNVDSEIDGLVRNAINQLEEMGAKVEIVKISSLEYSEYAEFNTYMPESALIHRENLRTKPSDFGLEVKSTLQLANLFSAVDYLEAQQMRKMMAEDFAKVFKQVDVLISPTLPIVTPKIGQETSIINGVEHSVADGLIRLTSPANLVGLPSISIPCGFVNGLPVGLSIMGSAFNEKEILNIAFAYEQTNPLKGKKPKLDQLIAK